MQQMAQAMAAFASNAKACKKGRSSKVHVVIRCWKEDFVPENPNVEERYYGD